MKKFKYPLAIEGTKEQLANLEPLLISLGYMMVNECRQYKHSSPWLLTRFGVHRYHIGYNQTRANHLVVNASNPDLVLALAAMVDDGEFYEGEIVKYIGNDHRWCTAVSGGQGNTFIVDKQTGRKEYLYVKPPPNAICNTPNTYIHHFCKATKEEIIQHFTKHTDPTEKKIIGYKVVTNILRWDYGTVLVKQSTGQWAPEGARPGQECVSNNHLLLEKDLFDPVYEEEIKIITLRCEGGTFEIEVSKKGIYYKPEDVYLSLILLRKAIDNKIMVSSTNKDYSFVPSHINSGCKKSVPVCDWVKVLDAYDDISK